ncbi:MAG: hypothetical protein K0R31_1949, partial [Clostridiales bacterium]|nr:hypothetical protein [Clostridiales bacterium]
VTSKAAFLPEKPVTIIVPAAPGGSTDLLARAIERVWIKYCPQPVLIVNKAGGAGLEGSLFVARSKSDGYLLLLGIGSGGDMIMPHIQKTEYDSFKIFDLVSLLSIHSVVVAVPQNSQFNTIKDIVSWAKKEKKPVTAAVSTTAGAVDLVMRGIGKTTGIDVTPIPHSGGSQAVMTLVSGQTLMGGGHPAEVLSHIKTKRIKPIAIGTPDRDPVLKDILTLKEQGINFSTWGALKGIAVAKNTPVEIKEYYDDLFKKISNDADFKKLMEDMAQPIQYQGTKEFTKFYKQVFDEYGNLVKELGLNAQ